MGLKLFDFLPFGARSAERRLKCPQPRRVIRNRCRRARARAFFAALAAVAVLGGGTAGAFWYFGIGSATAESVPLADDNTRPFEIHGVALGMDAEAVRKLHPRIAMHWRHDGGHVGQFVESGVTHSVWFTPGWKPGRVYRVSYRQIFPVMAPGAVLEQFAWQFGVPVSSTCETPAGQQGSVACTYKWMTRKGIAVEVRSRDLTGPAGGSVTVLTVTATDIDVGQALSQGAVHGGDG